MFEVQRGSAQRGAIRPLLLVALMLLSPLSRADVSPTAADLLSYYTDALRTNPVARSAEALSQVADRGVERARGKLLPQLSGFAEGAYVDESISGDYFGIVDVDRDDQYERYLYGASLSQALLQPALWAELGQAELRQQQSQLATRGQRATLLLNVAEAYFGALASQEAVGLVNARLEAVRQQRDQVVSQADAGLTTDAERQFAEAAVKLAMARRTEVESDARIATRRLHAVAGRHDARVLGLSPTFNMLLPRPTDEYAWVERARTNNLEVLQQTLAVQIATLDHKKAVRSRWPTVDLVGTAYQIDAGGGLAGERDEREARVGLRAAVPIYSGGQVTAGIEQALLQQQRAEAALEQAQTDAMFEARRAYLQMVSAQQQVGALQDAVDAARLAESGTRAGFEAGTRTSADVFNALEQRFAAEVRYQSLRYELLLQSLRLKQAAGTLAGADAVSLNRLLAGAVTLTP
ncbi:TolC family protein [Flagellatimonas centrodinii]|uniref:TolC family protein n=1 Tax=Flagellatimonas centrodinii TaxID=2806210 RepID=UPI001FFD7149|nr:TolC family protein [Flagellatimonas centrodinii]ULQ46394.1 TolC family protein [Flagellatimonas centrodinii]